MRLLLALLLAAGLVACQNEDAGSADTTAPVASTPSASPAADRPAPAARPKAADLAASEGDTRRHSGELADGDQTLESGEFADSYPFKAEAGQSVTVDVTTDGELDPYVILKSPSGSQEENDDWEGSTSHARVSQTAPHTGQYRAIVTSYESGESGSYDLTITIE